MLKNRVLQLLWTLAAATVYRTCSAQSISDACLASLETGPAHDAEGNLTAAGFTFQFDGEDQSDATAIQWSYNTPGTFALDPDLPETAVALYLLRSENFRIGRRTLHAAIGKLSHCWFR